MLLALLVIISALYLGLQTTNYLAISSMAGMGMGGVIAFSVSLFKKG